MANVLICLITALTFIGFIFLCVLCWRFWLQHGLDKFLNSEANRLLKRNDDLHRKLNAKKRENKQLIELLEKRDLEIEELEQNVQDIEQINSDLAQQIIEAGGEDAEAEK